ncbi:MAG: hypothetical protein GX596_06295 [Propionibacterium sp.]|nr:hypothetical protein [Propionibacterium sp.]
MPEHRRRSLLAGLLKVGFIGFGGGSALIPVIQDEVVDRRGLLSREQYTRHTIVANITPGALPVKLGAAAGVTLGGWKLALAAALAVTIPGVLGTLLLIALAQWLGEGAVRVVSYASVGITAFIIVLLLGYIIKVHAGAGHRLWRYVVITALASLATGAGSIITVLGRLVGLELAVDPPRISAVTLILVSLGIIVGWSLATRSTWPPKDPDAPRLSVRPSLVASAGFLVMTAVGVVAMVLLLGVGGLQLGSLLGLSSVTSFGGGEAYIGVADGYFVEPGHVDRGVFYTQLIPVANAMPGPILAKVASGIGFIAGAEHSGLVAWLAAASAMLIVVGACAALAMPVLGTYERLRHNPIVVNIGNYILPVICGLLVSVSATMLLVSAEVGEGAGANPTVLLWLLLGAIAGMAVLHLRKLIPDLLMLGVGGAISLAVLLLI